MTEINIQIIKRLEDIGTAKQLLKELISDNLFDDLSKHNPYWESIHEVEDDKLHDLRMKLMYLHEKIGEIYDVVLNDEIM